MIYTFHNLCQHNNIFNEGCIILENIYKEMDRLSARCNGEKIIYTYTDEDIPIIQFALNRGGINADIREITRRENGFYVYGYKYEYIKKKENLFETEE